MRIIVDVYRGCSYYPDLTVRGYMAARVSRRIAQLHEQGFECKVRQVATLRSNSSSGVRASGSLRAERSSHIMG